MTREEFNNAVRQSYKEFESEELAKTPEQIFGDSYEIATMSALVDYLTESDDEEIEPLYPYAETLLRELYYYEWHYDEPMWCEWDDISAMVEDFIEERSTQND